MGFLLSSREGRLCVDGKRVMTPYFQGMFPADQFMSGDLSLPATDINLKMVSQCYLAVSYTHLTLPTILLV